MAKKSQNLQKQSSKVNIGIDSCLNYKSNHEASNDSSSIPLCNIALNRIVSGNGTFA